MPDILEIKIIFALTKIKSKTDFQQNYFRWFKLEKNKKQVLFCQFWMKILTRTNFELKLLTVISTSEYFVYADVCALMHPVKKKVQSIRINSKYEER